MPNSIPVMCLICNTSIKDSQFPIHMASVHGGLSQGRALAAEKNIPQQQTPIILDKDTPPSPEFMEVAKMLDEKPKSEPPVEVLVKNPVQSQIQAPTQQEVKKEPIILKYKYEGNCPKCNTPIKTVVIKPGGKWFAVAFCLTHEEITQQEVSPLIKDEEIIMAKTYEEKMPEMVRKEVKRGKQRHKSIVRSNASVQAKVFPTGLRDSDKPSLQS